VAAGDLDHNGSIEVVATTTQTQPDGAQVFVFNPDGSLYQPPGLSFKAWPRYNTATGEGNDADVNGPGNHGYGCYGLNVGIGNLDDDPEEEIVITFDNHQINVFHHTGVSLPASPYFTNRSPTYLGNRLNWGQFIRWFDAEIEYNHYNLHTGTWPTPIRQKWLQWTQSPPSVADINGDQHKKWWQLPTWKWANHTTPSIIQSWCLKATGAVETDRPDGLLVGNLSLPPATHWVGQDIRQAIHRPLPLSTSTAIPNRKSCTRLTTVTSTAPRPRPNAFGVMTSGMDAV